jgi:hypothetical protein
VNSSFDQALVEFGRFLSKNGYPEEVRWLLPEDVLLSDRRHIHVKVPVPSTNETRARELYDLSVSQGIGIPFGTICMIDDTTYAYAWSPRDSEEAELRLMGNGLKMSLHLEDSKVAGETVSHMLRWLYLRLRLRRKQAHRAELFC